MMKYLLSSILTICLYSEAKRVNENSRILYTQEALGDEVTSLPDLSYTPGFRMFSGYLTLPDNALGNDRQIFYWYVESQDDPRNDPLVYWTNGGPGCSGLQGFGFIHGPFLFGENGVSENPYSWNKMANMLYVEQPIGVGFSYSNKSLPPYTDAMATEEQYQILVAFYKKFPATKPNSLYLTSESYGGHYIPLLALYIIEEVKDTTFNLKGIAVGNPSADFKIDEVAAFQMFYFRGLIEQNLWRSWWKNGCKKNFKKWATEAPRGKCYDIEDEIFGGTGEGFNWAALDYPICVDAQKTRRKLNALDIHASRGRTSHTSADGNQILKRRERRSVQSKQHKAADRHERSAAFGMNYEPCRKEYFTKYLGRPDVMSAIHADGSKVATGKWDTCNDDVFWDFSVEDYYTDYVPYYKKLVTGNYNLDIMIYSGDNDGIIPYVGTSRWIHRMGVPAEDNFKWNEWTVNSQQAGFMTKFNVTEDVHSFVFVVVTGAGHEVPSYKPAESLDMWRRYLNKDWDLSKDSTL